MDDRRSVRSVTCETRYGFRVQRFALVVVCALYFCFLQVVDVNDSKCIDVVAFIGFAGSTLVVVDTYL